MNGIREEEESKEREIIRILVRLREEKIYTGSKGNQKNTLARSLPIGP